MTLSFISQKYAKNKHFRVVYFDSCSVPIGLIFYRERASQPAKNETKEKRWKEEKETLN